MLTTQQYHVPPHKPLSIKKGVSQRRPNQRLTTVVCSCLDRPFVARTIHEVQRAQINSERQPSTPTNNFTAPTPPREIDTRKAHIHVKQSNFRRFVRKKCELGLVHTALVGLSATTRRCTHGKQPANAVFHYAGVPHRRFPTSLILI